MQHFDIWMQIAGRRAGGGAKWQLCNIKEETIPEDRFMKKIYCVEI